MRLTGAVNAAVAVLLFLSAALLPAARCDPQRMMEMEGFTIKRPSGGQGRQSGKPVSGWASTQWRAVQANLTQQLKDADGSFDNYRANRGRKYKTTAEQTTARTQFKKNLQYIVAENAKGTNPYILGITNFTDLSYADFAARFLMAPQTPPKTAIPKKIGRRLSGLRGEPNRQLLQTTNATLATSDCSVNWGMGQYNPLGRGVVSPVKYQGGCGSCWAFVVAAQLEAWTAMQNITMDAGNFMDLSEQMLVDCSYSSNYDGCQGGWPTAAFDFAKANGGVPSEAAVPYVSGNTWVGTGSCPYTTKPRQLGSNLIKDYQLVTPQNDQGVATAVMKQPVVVAVAAGPEFQNYAGGAIVCNGTAVTHAVQVVGCGYIPSPDGTSTLPVYIIKNSWSSYWGYSGFAWVLRTQEQWGNCMIGSGAYTLS